tara:strand:+ start:656 stop:2053 length:1398 start_codon:yes stop_codon:yes gene_type:complete
MSISSFLKKKFSRSLFFPSHNRGQALPKKLIQLLKEEPGLWDLPELPELGSPLSSVGIIRESQDYFAKLFSMDGCWFGVNGASGLIQSAILSMANPGDYILMPRNIHICVIKICIVANIIPVLFDLEFSEISGQYLPITSEWLSKILDDSAIKSRKISGIILVNPYYQGHSADIRSLIELCHLKKIPVLVDEAHGSYFLFCENFGLPVSAVRAKADLVVHSLHKSLNGLTQTAMLWHYGNIIDRERLERNINFLQTTSPSSLLLASCEESLRDWLQKDSILQYKKRIKEARVIFDELTRRNVPLIQTDDPLKIILNTGAYGINGFTADNYFYKKGFIAELPTMMTLTFCLGFVKQKNFVDLFESHWKGLIFKVKKEEALEPIKPPFKLIQIPEISPTESLLRNSYKTSLKESIGKISADIICPYPPGIPLAIPGERIEKERVDWLTEQGLMGEDLLNFYIKVLIH